MDQRFDGVPADRCHRIGDLRRNLGHPDNANQRLQCGRTAPAEDRNQRAQRLAVLLDSRRERTDACNAQRPAREIDDVRAGAERIVLTRMDAIQCGGNLGDTVGVDSTIQDRDERRHRVFVANLRERVDYRWTKQLVVEKRRQCGSDARIVGPSERRHGGKRQKEITGACDFGQAIDGITGSDGAERLDRVEPDVRFLVVERRDQGWHGNRIPNVAERQRRVHAQIRLRIRKQLNQRRDDVAIGCEHLERAAHDVQVLVTATKCVEQVRDFGARGALPQIPDGKPAKLPVAGPDCVDRTP